MRGVFDMYHLNHLSPHIRINWFQKSPSSAVARHHSEYEDALRRTGFSLAPDLSTGTGHPGVPCSTCSLHTKIRASGNRAGAEAAGPAFQQGTSREAQA